MNTLAPPAGRDGESTRRAKGGTGEGVRLPVRVRLADGRTFTGTLPAGKHRALQLGLLHGESEGLVELTKGTRPPGAKVDIDRRTHACHYLPGGAGANSDGWLERLLEHSARIVAGEYAYRQFDGGRARRRSSASRRARGRRGPSTPSPTPGSCGLTLTSLASCPRCGDCSLSVPATCWWNRARAACTRTGSLSSPSPQSRSTVRAASGSSGSSARISG
jgi:hypothetical protein